MGVWGRGREGGREGGRREGGGEGGGGRDGGGGGEGGEEGGSKLAHTHTHCSCWLTGDSSAEVFRLPKSSMVRILPSSWWKEGLSSGVMAQHPLIRL